LAVLTLDVVLDANGAERLRLALDLYRMSEQVQRARLRRDNPDASTAEIEAAVSEWRRSDPTALSTRARWLSRHQRTRW
jgi:hypothetical protein